MLFTKILEGGVINGATIQIGEGKDREVIQLDVIEEARVSSLKLHKLVHTLLTII